jgi:hypothetical protein
MNRKFTIGDRVCFIGESVELYVYKIVNLPTKVGEQLDYHYLMEDSDGYGYTGREEDIEFVKEKIRREKIELLLDGSE